MKRDEMRYRKQLSILKSKLRAAQMYARLDIGGYKRSVEMAKEVAARMRELQDKYRKGLT